MKTKETEYYVWNRITTESQNVYAPSAQEACEKVGWMIGDCQVKDKIKKGGEDEHNDNGTAK